MPEPEPGVVEITGELQIAPDLVVVPNRHLDLVPNIGVIGGTHSVLVVETGMGPRNAEKVLTFAAGYANGRRLYLTTTHFHPEHAFGAQVFAGEATYVANRAQADDLAAKGDDEPAGHHVGERDHGESLRKRVGPRRQRCQPDRTVPEDGLHAFAGRADHGSAAECPAGRGARPVGATQRVGSLGGRRRARSGAPRPPRRNTGASVDPLPATIPIRY
jgi:hypothetical protein